MYLIIDKLKTAYRSKYVGTAIAAHLIFAVLIGALFAPAAYATDPWQGNLTVEQIIVNNSSATPPPATFIYRLASQTAGAPMPHGSGPEGFIFAMTGNSTLAMPSINFDTPGIFVYELLCTTHSDSNFTVDRTVYTIEVYIESNMQITTVVYIDDKVKAPAIDFRHIFRFEEPELPGTPSPTPYPPATPSPTPQPPGASPTPPPPPGTPTPNPTPGPTATPDPTPHPTETPNPTSHPPGTVPPAPNPSTPSGGGSPKTGDFSNPTLWITLIVISGMLLILIIYLLAKPKKKGVR